MLQVLAISHYSTKFEGLAHQLLIHGYSPNASRVSAASRASSWVAIDEQALFCSLDNSVASSQIWANLFAISFLHILVSNSVNSVFLDSLGIEGVATALLIPPGTDKRNGRHDIPLSWNPLWFRWDTVS